jgi:hypothetical protein
MRWSTRSPARYEANTKIPISRFAADVLAALPLPNSPGRANNFTNLLLVRDFADKYDAKLNYTINNKMTSFLRFSQRKDIVYNQPNIGGISGGAGNGFINATQQQAATGYTWNLTPSSLLEARFGFRTCWRAERQHQAVVVAGVFICWPADDTDIAGDQYAKPSAVSPRSPSHQSAIPEPHFIQPEDSLHLTARNARRQARVLRSARRCATSTRLRVRRLRANSANRIQ